MSSSMMMHPERAAASDPLSGVPLDLLPLIANAIPLLIVYVDARERYVFVNQTYEAWYGSRPQELIGKTVREVVGSEEAYRTVEPYIRRVLSGERFSFDALVPYPIRGARWIRASYIPRFDAHQNVTGWVGVAEDITNARRIEERRKFLSEATTLLSSSLDYNKTLDRLAKLLVPELADWCAIEMLQDSGATEQVAVAHVDPKKVEFARELRRRYPPDPNAPTGAARVIRTRKAELYPEITDEMLVRGARDEDHLRISRELGLRSAICVPIATQDRLYGAMTLVSSERGRRYDENDLLLAEQLADRAAIAIENALLFLRAQDAIAHRDRFLSVASHELRTPLTSLQLQTDSMIRTLERKPEEGLRSGRLMENAKSAARQIRRLTELIETLLDVSRVREQRMLLDLEPDIDLALVATETIERLRESAEDSGCAITVIAAGPVLGVWDRLRLEQIATNLMTNAIKYGAGEPIEVRVEMIGNRARLSVRDRGIGVGDGDKERIFGRFERALAAEAFSGLGLGLWITRELVEAHRGTIRVESGGEKGSIFIVELPCRAGAETGGEGRAVKK